MNPSESVSVAVAEVREKHDATSKSLTFHYERSSEWLTEAIQTCKRKILEGTGHEVSEPPKRMKKATPEDKENLVVSNIQSSVKVEKKARMFVPASFKKTKKDVPPGYNRVMSLKVMALREELHQRSLDTTGLKKDLQVRLLNAITEEIEDSKKRDNKSVVKSAQKAKRPKVAQDGNGDVQMKDSKNDSNDARCDSSKMDIDEEATRRMNDAPEAKSSPKKNEAAKETTVAKSFLKSTAELFSPSKIANKMHLSKHKPIDMEVSSVIENDASKKQQAPRMPLKEGLKKTASAILSSASPSRKASVSHPTKSPAVHNESVAKAKVDIKEQDAPVNEIAAAAAAAENLHAQQSKSSSKSSAESEYQSFTAAAVPAIPNKLGSVDKNVGAATKAKRDQVKADRTKRLEEIRGKSKPIPGVPKATAPGLPSLSSSSKALKLGSAKTKEGKTDRKVQLTTQMREKAKALGTVPLSSTLASTSKQSSAPSAATASVSTVSVSDHSQSKPIFKVTASPSLVKQMKQVAASHSVTKPVKTSSSKKKSSAHRPDILSPMSTYEMSDREQSDTDDSESESYQQRKKKKVPSWAQKQNLLPALENQYANRNGRLDPETIFPPVTTCNLYEIFDQKKSRYRQRTSSANWSKDGVTHTEIVAYKRTMGY